MIEAQIGQEIEISELAEELLKKKFIDISSGFPVKDGTEFVELMKILFRRHGISRIPIIAIDNGGSIQTFALITNQRQEHAQLGKKMGLMKEDPSIVFTTSLERFPSKNIPSAELGGYYMLIDTTEGVFYQHCGKGSDFYTKPMTMEGREEIRAIFPFADFSS